MSRPAAGPFSAATMGWMILVGVTATVALLLLAAFQPQLNQGEGDTHVLSRSAVGFAAIARLTEASGATVEVLRGPMEPGEKAGLLVLTPDILDSVSKVQAVEAAGPRLVVLPKWRTAPDPAKPRWVMLESLLPAGLLGQIVSGYAPGSTVAQAAETGRQTLIVDDGERRPVGSVRKLQTFAGPDWKPLVRTSDGRMVVGCLDEVCVLSDPDLLNTQGMKSLETARFATGLIARLKGPGPVMFDATLHGVGSGKNIFTLLMTPPFLGMTLCLAAMAALLAAHAAVRFGPAARPERAIALGKAGLADNTAALIRRAGREHRLLRRYAVAQRDAVAAAVGAPRNLDEPALEAFLDRLGEAAGAGRISELIVQAGAVGPQGDLMAVAHSLHRWRMEMTRER